MKTNRDGLKLIRGDSSGAGNDGSRGDLADLAARVERLEDIVSIIVNYLDRQAARIIARHSRRAGRPEP